MRLGALIIGVLGAVMGFSTAIFERSGLHSSLGDSLGGFLKAGGMEVTAVVSAIGLVGAILMWRRPGLGAVLCFAAAVLGVLGAYILWEAAGSFFFIAALLGYMGRNQTGEDGA